MCTCAVKLDLCLLIRSRSMSLRGQVQGQGHWLDVDVCDDLCLLWRNCRRLKSVRLSLKHHEWATTQHLSIYCRCFLLLPVTDKTNRGSFSTAQLTMLPNINNTVNLKDKLTFIHFCLVIFIHSADLSGYSAPLRRRCQQRMKTLHFPRSSGSNSFKINIEPDTCRIILIINSNLNFKNIFICFMEHLGEVHVWSFLVKFF